MKLDQLIMTLPTLCLAFLLALLPTRWDEAQASRIVAIVNGAVITDLDVGQRQKLERLLSGGKKRLSRSAALNVLIDDKLKLFEARERNMQTSEKEVDTALANMARNVRLSQKKMLGIFRQAGVNKQTLKSWLKAQLSWRRLVRARYNAQIRVDEIEIIRAISKDGASKQDVESTVLFDLQQVTFISRTKASKRQANQRLAEAKRFRASFASCERDLATARRLKDVAVTRVGRRQSTDLPPQLVKRLRETPVNKLTAPTKVDNGYEMVAVCGKQDLGKQATLKSEAEAKLKDERGRSLSRKYLGELRSRAIIEKR